MWIRRHIFQFVAIRAELLTGCARFDRIAENAHQVERAAEAVTTLTTNVASLTTNVASLASTISAIVDGNSRRTARLDQVEKEVGKLKARPVIYSAIGAAIGAVGPSLINLMIQGLNNR